MRENDGMEMPRNERSPENAQRILVVGQDGMALGGIDADEDPREIPVTDMVEQPAKVMRIGSMIKQLLEEVRAAPLDEASRVRLKEIHASSVKELEDGLGAGAGRGTGAAVPAVQRGLDAERRGTADRAGPVGRLAGGPLPRHPDHALRPADGRARPVGADAPCAAAGCGPRGRRRPAFGRPFGRTVPVEAR